MSSIDSSSKEEVWVDVKDYEGVYQISNFGSVRSLDRVVERFVNGNLGFLNLKGSIKKSFPDSKGYLSVQLNNKTSKTYLVHRLVADHFLPKPSDALVEDSKSVKCGKVLVNHRDGNKLNASVDNLEWCNHAYNNLKSLESYDVKQGEDAIAAKLKREDVEVIVDLSKTGKFSQQSLADKFNVAQITISNILTGKSWNSVTGIEKTRKSYKLKKKSLVDGCH